MKLAKIILSTLVTMSFQTNAQVILDLQTELNTTISEVSGIIWIEGRLIGHNDSGDDANLYEINPVSGEVIRTVMVENATNIDWEDITYDEDYIYIADFGNNDGNRTNLMIYKISKSDFLSMPTVIADTIKFNYAEQIDFSPGPYSTNFDAESIISLDDSLYIFTKNWGDFKSNIYALSKSPGDYTISRKDSLDPNCMITGATYSAVANEIYLCGYDVRDPYIYYITGFSGDHFSEATTKRRFEASVLGSIQIEGIEYIDEYFYLAAEARGGSKAALYMGIINFLDIDKSDDQEVLRLFPNPTTGSIHIPYPTDTKCIIYDLTGGIVLSTSSKDINLSNLQKGLYIAEIRNTDNELILTQQIVKN